MGFMGFDSREQWEQAAKDLLQKDPCGYAAYQFLIDRMADGYSYGEALSAMDKAFRLYMARIKKGLSVQEAASALNTTEATIREYERGKRVPRDSVKQAMSALYGVPVPALFF